MEFETVVQTISEINNMGALDTRIKAFYNTFSDVEVIGYSTVIGDTGKLIVTTTLMGMKANKKPF